MKKTTNRLWLTFIAVMIFITPIYSQFSGGTGTSANPWRIANADDLNEIRNYLGEGYTNTHFRQTANIDLTAYGVDEGWIPIGGAGSFFYGNYDGRNFRISNLTISRDSATMGIGLFGYINNANIRNVRLENASVVCNGTEERVGIFAGYARDSVIHNCRVQGSIRATRHNVGGLAGRIDNTQVTSCQAEIDIEVNAPAEPFIYNLGGLIGRNLDNSLIGNSWTKGTVTGNNVRRVGGLVGDNATVETILGASITESWSEVKVSGDMHVGGLVGRNYSEPEANPKSSIDNCYAEGDVGCDSLEPSGSGGLVGLNLNSLISNSFATGNVEGESWVGGLVGHNSSDLSLTSEDRSIIYRCYAEGNVDSFVFNTGGLVGRNSNSIVRESFATGNVTTTQGTGDTPYNTGGLVGRNINDSLIENSYATGKVVGVNRVGGLVGQNNPDEGTTAQIINSYSIGIVAGESAGGLIGGDFSGNVISSYWDTVRSGQATSYGNAGAMGRTTEQMTQQATFTDWEFTDIWSIKEGATYPYLDWQGDDLIDDNMALFNMEFAADRYSITIGGNAIHFNPQEGDAGETEITVKYATNPSYSSIQLFSHPEYLSAYYGFWFDNQADLIEGQSFRLRFPANEEPNNIHYRFAGGEWAVLRQNRKTLIEEEPDYTYLIDIEGLFEARRDSTATVEFAADIGGEGQTLPVELSSFTVSTTANREVKLEWITQSESNMLGYNILRSITDRIDDADKITPVLIPAHNTSETTKYIHLDREVSPGILYYYWLEIVSMDLSTDFYGPISIQVNDEDEGEGGIIPSEYITELIGAYPNPFNISTSIEFSLETDENVTIKIYNLKGQYVRTIIDNRLFTEGKHRVIWDGKNSDGLDCPTGVYFYTFRTGKEVHSFKKMLLLK